MSGQRGCALSFKRGTAQECASLERGTIRCELEQGRARARARSEEAEAVDGRPFERLRQDRVDSRADRLPLGLPDMVGRSMPIDPAIRDEGSSVRQPRPLPLSV